MEFSATALDRVTVRAFHVADLRELFARDPKMGYAMMERAAQALLERLQATRHKLRVYVKRASGDENTSRSASIPRLGAASAGLDDILIWQHVSVLRHHREACRF